MPRTIVSAATRFSGTIGCRNLIHLGRYCLPVTDVQKTLDFYKGVFGFGDAQIDGDMLALELSTKKANRDALMPGASAPAVMSCAVETREDVDQALGKTEVYGGASAGPAAIDAGSGGYTGYVTDPDGHLWELVCPQGSPAACFE